MIYCVHCVLSKVLDPRNTVIKMGTMVPSGSLQPSGGDKNQTNKHRSKQNANCIVSKEKKNKDKYKGHTEKTTLGKWVRGSLSIEITLN